MRDDVTLMPDEATLVRNETTLMPNDATLVRGETILMPDNATLVRNEANFVPFGELLYKKIYFISTLGKFISVVGVFTTNESNLPSYTTSNSETSHQQEY
jgi:hypothetical protein